MPRYGLVLLIIVAFACACSGMRGALPGVPPSQGFSRFDRLAMTVRPSFAPVSAHATLGKNKRIPLPMPSGFSAELRLSKRSIVHPGTAIYATASTGMPAKWPFKAPPLLLTDIVAGDNFVAASGSEFSFSIPRRYLDPGTQYAVALFDPSNPAAAWQLGYTAPAAPKGQSLTIAVKTPSFVAPGVQYAFALYAGAGATPPPATRYELRGMLAQTYTFAYPVKSPFPTVTSQADVVQYYTVDQEPTTPPRAIRATTALAVHVTEADTTALQTTAEGGDEYFQPGNAGMLLGSVDVGFEPFSAAPDRTTTVYSQAQQLMPGSAAQQTWTNDPKATVDQIFSDGSSYSRSIFTNGSYREKGSVPQPGSTPVRPAIVESTSGAGSYSGDFYRGVCAYEFSVPSNNHIVLSSRIPATPPAAAGCNPPASFGSIPAWFPTPPPPFHGGSQPALYDERDVASANPTLPQTCGAQSGTKQRLLVTRNTWTLDTIVGFSETTTTKTYYGASGVVCMTLSDVIDEYYDWKGDAVPGQRRGEPYVSVNGNPIATVLTTENLALPQSGGAAISDGVVAAAAQVRFFAKAARIRAMLARAAFGQIDRESGGGASFTWASVARARMRYAGAAGGAEPMQLFVQVRMRDPLGLQRAAAAASMPGSQQYRQFLTPDKIADRFLATRADYDAVKRYFSNAGLHVVSFPQRHVVEVLGTAAQIGKAFDTTIARFTYGGRTALAPLSPPHVPPSLPVASVVGLVKYAAFSMLGRANSNDFAGYSPQQIARGLDFAGAYNLGYDGKGITAGIVQLGAIYPADVQTYRNTFDWPMANILAVEPVPSPHPKPTPTFDTFEAGIDTQSVAALAPGAQDEFLENSGSSWYQSLELAIARNVDDSISISVSDPEPYVSAGGGINRSGTGTYQIALAVLSMEGIAVFASSGDDGSADKAQCIYDEKQTACVAYPASDANVVAVGAVDVPLDAAGNRNGEITAWGSSTQHGGPLPPPVKGKPPCNCVGSGGGYSKVIGAPPWQRQALATGGSAKYTGYREVPDIALDGAPQTGVAIVVKGVPGVAAGTSLAAPMANAMWTVVLSACAQSAACSVAKGAKPYRLGNPSALFYQIYRGKRLGKQSYADVFYDVLYGSNTPVLTTPTPANPVPKGYVAGPGYDLVTGVGVPMVGHLIDAIVPGAGVP